MIETHDLSKQFGDFWAVDGISLDIKPGQLLALLGQNGAGKTTTVRMLTALLNPTRGWARVAGFDVTKNGRDVRSAVGVLTEQHGLYMRMTADEYLDFFGQVYRLSPKFRSSRSTELMEYFGLAEVAHRRIGEYSKGMRQKLALARALLHDPAVLLLDEPTSAMDPESARLVRDEIARLKSSQRTIVICTHNLAEAEELADIIAVVYRGRLLIKGTLDELKDKVLGTPEYEVKFSEPWDAGQLKLPEGVELVARKPDGFRFRVNHPETANPQLISSLISSAASVVSVQEGSRSLEEVYLKVMSESRGEIHAA
jgi:ABC-2 type transport system ATP-binding protein